jgi:hypothetical protein
LPRYWGQSPRWARVRCAERDICPRIGGKVRKPRFCKDAKQIRIGVLPEQRELTYVRLEFTESAFGPACSAQRVSILQDLPLPSLELPEGATQTGGGGTSASSTGGSTSIMFETPATAGDIVQHFAPQLQRQGWTRASGKVGDGLGSEVWKLQREGRVWQGLLLVAEFSGTKSRYALFQVNISQ